MKYKFSFSYEEVAVTIPKRLLASLYIYLYIIHIVGTSIHNLTFTTVHIVIQYVMCQNLERNAGCYW